MPFNSTLAFLLLLSIFQQHNTPNNPKPENTIDPSVQYLLQNGIKLDIVKILEFKLIEGKSEWIQNSKNALLNTCTIHFGNDYGCTMYISGNTLTGKYWMEDKMITIFVESHSFSGGQGTTINVNGLFQGRDDKNAPGLGAIHFLSTAKYYAKINGSEMRNTVSKEYTCSFDYVTTTY